MATATLSYSNLQQHEQTWSGETTGLLSPKSPEPTPKWGQTDNSNATFQPNNESNTIQPNKTNNVDQINQENSDSDEIIYTQDDKNREIRECLKNIQTSDDPDKAYWNYFKTVLEQEGHEKAQAAYLEYIKNERLLACIQAYKVQAEAKYQWSERQRLKEEQQLHHYKQLMNLDEVALHNRTSQQAMSEIDYFKSKWESYALPTSGAISPDIYKDDLMNKNQENLLQKNGNYIQQYQDIPQVTGHGHANVQDIVDVDGTNYYINSGLQDQKPNAQYIAQHLAQKMVQPAMKRIIGNKGDCNTLDDIMADFQSNGRDSTAPPSPRASRAWGATTTSSATATPISVRPTLRQMIFPHANAATCFGNISPTVASPAVVNSLATSLPRTEAELIRQLNSLIGATSAQLQKQQQQLYPNQAQYGIQVGGLTDSQFRRRRSTVTSTECAFCRNNGEQPAVYRGHILKDAEGRVRCPILRDYTCRNCGATGDAAHTVKYCPLTPKTDLSFTQLQKNLRMANGKRRGSQETTQWTTCEIP